MSYVLGRGTKIVVEDNFHAGEVPGTGFETTLDLNMKKDTVEDLLEEVAKFFGVEIEDIERNADDQEGRIRFDVMENEEGSYAWESELEAWKRGEHKLFSCIYYFDVYYQGRASL